MLFYLVKSAYRMLPDDFRNSIENTIKEKFGAIWDNVKDKFNISSKTEDAVAEQTSESKNKVFTLDDYKNGINDFKGSMDAYASFRDVAASFGNDFDSEKFAEAIRSDEKLKDYLPENYNDYKSIESMFGLPEHFSDIDTQSFRTYFDGATENMLAAVESEDFDPTDTKNREILGMMNAISSGELEDIQDKLLSKESIEKDAEKSLSTDEIESLSEALYRNVMDGKTEPDFGGTIEPVKEPSASF